MEIVDIKYYCLKFNLLSNWVFINFVNLHGWYWGPEKRAVCCQAGKYIRTNLVLSYIKAGHCYTRLYCKHRE